jgi:ribosome-associated protein
MPDDNEEELTPSKSQRKRDLADLRSLGEQLLSIPEDQLEKLENPTLIEALLECKKIRKGNARKRQIQYIGKLLRQGDADIARELIDRFDASSKSHLMQFHRLEQWRERLISDDADVTNEIADEYPDLDRQHLRQLVRNAASERTEERDPPIHYRKLFQYLKSLAD